MRLRSRNRGKRKTRRSRRRKDKEKKRRSRMKRRGVERRVQGGRIRYRRERGVNGEGRRE